MSMCHFAVYLMEERVPTSTKALVKFPAFGEWPIITSTLVVLLDMTYQSHILTWAGSEERGYDEFYS
jgi:hypothetical protein